MDMNLSKFQETAEDRGAWHAAVHGVTELITTEQLNSNYMEKRLPDEPFICTEMTKSHESKLSSSTEGIWNRGGQMRG